jgi:hypothetical protein
MSGKPKEYGAFEGAIQNHIAPFTHGISAPITYIALEVLVSKLIRRFVGTNLGWMELLQIHTLSLPFIGPLMGWFDPPIKHQAFVKKKATTEADKYAFTDQLMDGAKGIPAVLFAEYILETFRRGFHYPKMRFKDIAVTAVAKTATRPLTVAIFPYLPADNRASYLVLEAIFAKLAVTSRGYDNAKQKGMKASGIELFQAQASKKKADW